MAATRKVPGGYLAMYHEDDAGDMSATTRAWICDAGYVSHILRNLPPEFLHVLPKWQKITTAIQIVFAHDGSPIYLSGQLRRNWSDRISNCRAWTAADSRSCTAASP